MFQVMLVTCRAGLTTSMGIILNKQVFHTRTTTQTSIDFVKINEKSISLKSSLKNL